jgi:uncharacterized protein YfaS (alpha-2-macroglobulin family)
MVRSWRRLALTAGLVIAATAALAAPKTYRRDDLASESLRLQAEFARTAKPGGLSGDQAMAAGVAAIRGGDWRAAISDMAQAIAADPGSERAWRNEAVALLRAKPKDDGEGNELAKRAAGAAYQDYLLAPDKAGEARALALIGEAYARQHMFRPAIDALKASLDRNERPDVRASYAQLRAQYGFRVLNYTVDANAANPRACVQFSEKLAPGRRDFSPYVHVEGMASPAVTAGDQQLCIDGLRHGQRYAVTIRAGLPSAVGEDLLTSHTLTVYVRDGAPAVRFTGRNYVLPRAGQQGLPLVSVNVEKVAFEIFRVGNRNLAPQIVAGDFQRQISADDIEKLQGTTGAKVFAGTLVVKNELNQDVTTAVPLDRAIRHMAPGVYVMVARPAGAKPESWQPEATQWFIVSDLGLTAISGEDGLHALVRSLASAKPLAKVALRLVARNNEVLGTATTDSAGFALFPAGLTSGTGGSAPAMLAATGSDGDYGFLSLTQPGFDLSDRGVAGRPAPGPLDAQLYAERGIYRPGETVHLLALLRDPAGAAVERLPLTLVVQRPDGVEARRVTLPDQGAGGRTFDLPLLASAQGGTWRIEAYADPKQPPIGDTSFLVADYVPERLAMTVTSDAKTLGPGPATVRVDGRWLYGAPAAGLALDGEIAIAPADAPPGAPAGYHFGLADQELAPQRTPLEGLPRTDAKGTVDIQVPVPALPDTTRPLAATVTLRLREPGGRALERSLVLPVASDHAFIGVKPLFSGRAGEGDTVRFAVKVLAGKAGAPQSLKWELSRIETRFQWYATGGSWRYDTVTIASRVADGAFNPDADGTAAIAAKVDYGHYRLEVSSSDPSGPATSYDFDAGWYEAAASADTPDLLDVALDRPMVKPGETVQLRIAPRFAGRATVLVVTDKVLESREFEIPAGGASVPLKVSAAWRPGAYVIVFLHRPLDAAASRMPGRAIGVVYAKIDPAPQTLSVRLGVPAHAAPRGRFVVPVTVGNREPHGTAYVTAAVVDVGILNLTHYEPPAPDERAFGQRRLSADIRDLYGQLIDGMTAARGEVRSGGDMGAPSFAETPTQAPLALFSGIVPVGPDGKAEIPFDLPAFNGTVKVMVTAWSAGKLGHADAEVTVADPVVVTGTPPHFLALGDRSRLLLDLADVSGPAGTYQVTVEASGGVRAEGTGTPLQLPLSPGGHADVAVPLTGAALGAGRIDVAVTGPDGRRYEQSYAVPVEPAQPPETTRVAREIPPGGTVTIGADVLAGYLPGTASVAVAVAPPGALSPAPFAAALDTYPLRCSEQLSSRLVALLNLKAAGLPQPADLGETVERMIADILARQDSAGGFGLWAPGEDDLWLDAYVTDELARAREAGYTVSERALGMALDHLRNTVGIRSGDADIVTPEVIFAQYVLARNGRGQIGDLRYLADARLDAIKTPLARAELAAALDLMGDRTRAARAFAAAAALLASQHGDDEAIDAGFGSPLREGAGVLALAAEHDAAIVPAVARTVADERSERQDLSTQENAWLLRAALATRKAVAGLRLTVNGVAQSGAVSRVVPGASLVTAPLTVANAGPDPVRAAITLHGTPAAAQPAVEDHGFKLERRYFTPDGRPADPAHVAQNTRLVVVLTAVEAEPEAGRLVLIDRLPAGFEIDNPRLVSSADLRNFAWLPEGVQPVHSEFQDDRFVGAFTRGEGEDAPLLTAAYVVRAVAPGTYSLPPATVADMYRPDRFGRTVSGTVEVTAGP